MRLFRALAAASLLLILPALPAGVSSTPTASPSPTVDDGTRSRLVPMLGLSGDLRASFGLAATLAQDSAIGALLADVPIAAPGVHSLGLATVDGDSLFVVSLEPLPAGQGITPAGYRVGRWPSTGRPAFDPSYARPAGFIPVTPENQDTPISRNFRLRDFLTHDQKDVWPKALVLRIALVDKLELIRDELERRGLPSTLRVMSGFRTPQYNALGVGARGGRASNSRHMYGDAADVFVDDNGDERMDDLDRDGRETVKDARVLFAVVEAVEAAHPGLVGGLSAYPSSAAHGPFVHVDARGTRARW